MTTGPQRPAIPVADWRRRLAARLSAVLENHAYTAVSSLGRLWRRPVTALMTLAVIAIALALPSGLYLLVKNAQALGGSWQRLGDIALFLAPQTELTVAEQLAESIRARPDVARVQLIPADAALADFRRHSDFSAALDALTDNPLPHVLAVTPREGLGSAQVTELTAALEALDSVDFAQFDMVWLIRFNAMVETARQIVQLIAALLVLGVLLIVGNTIRLDIDNRREEIEITKMLGGTDAFIRRPFLYGGIWYGLLGGLGALLLIVAAMTTLAGPARGVADAYGSSFRMVGPTLPETVALVSLAGVMGLLGSWLAVGRHLAEIQPR